MSAHLFHHLFLDLEIVFESFNSAVTVYREMNGFDLLCDRLQHEMDVWLRDDATRRNQLQLSPLPDFNHLGRLRLIESLLRVLHLTLAVNLRNSRIRSILGGKLPGLLRSLFDHVGEVYHLSIPLAICSPHLSLYIYLGWSCCLVSLCCPCL